MTPDLEQAHAIQQERHWWCEWDERLQAFKVRQGFTWGSCNVKRDDGTPFTGPDPSTPLIEAHSYMTERGR